MPRLSNSANCSFYHYLIKVYNDDTKEELVEERYCKTQKEITDKYGLNRSAIFYLLNPIEGRVKRKYNNFKLSKVLEPIYRQEPIFNNGIVPLPNNQQIIPEV